MIERKSTKLFKKKNLKQCFVQWMLYEELWCLNWAEELCLKQLQKSFNCLDIIDTVCFWTAAPKTYFQWQQFDLKLIKEDIHQPPPFLPPKKNNYILNKGIYRRSNALLIKRWFSGKRDNIRDKWFVIFQYKFSSTWLAYLFVELWISLAWRVVGLF